MKIMLINGSPKKKNSASENILAALIEKLGESEEILILSANSLDKQVFLDELAACDGLVFIFPLYVDGIPSHLLRLLDESLVELKKLHCQLRVYAIVNNGFYEGKQNSLALNMIEHFATAAGFHWGQGLGVGAGGMVSAAKIGTGPLRNLGLALATLAHNIKSGSTAPNFYIEPNFPRFLYKTAGHFGWCIQARRNKVKYRELCQTRDN